VRAVARGKSGVFGVDVFQRTTTQFLPLLAGPVPADYKLGPGDQLVLILTGDVELAYTLQVTREGFILIPQVGQLFVSNLTLDQLRDVLYKRLGRVYSGVRRTPGAPTRLGISGAAGDVRARARGDARRPAARRRRVPAGSVVAPGGDRADFAGRRARGRGHRPGASRGRVGACERSGAARWRERGPSVAGCRAHGRAAGRGCSHRGGATGRA